MGRLDDPAGPMRLRTVLVVGIPLVLAGVIVWNLTRDYPVDYRDDVEHFKYGSIGSEPGGSPLQPVGGLLPPEWIFKVLPKVCPGMPSYAELGLIYERDRDGTVKDLPIGVSRRRRLGSDMVGVNCALCHAGTVRTAPDAAPQVIPGMPPQQTDVQRLLRHLFECIQSRHFTVDNVIREIRAAGGPAGLLHLVKYRLLIPRIRGKVGELAEKIGVLAGDRLPASGPGRLDTINPGKALEVGWDLEERLSRDGVRELTGTMDFPPTWNLRERDGMQLHWDGNISTVHEAILSAVLAVGAKPQTVDDERLKRVIDYLDDLAPPRYLFSVDGALAERGEPLFELHCAECHAFAGSKVGAVTPISALGTDRFRLDAFSREYAVWLPAALNHRYAGSEFQFTTFRKTDGYANVPLDGIWARAPYLHNGSVPTLRDLLEPERCRPPIFSRGSDIYDPLNVGFQSGPEPSADASCPRWAKGSRRVPGTGPGGARLFRFDTSLPGNGNTGHPWGTDLPDAHKQALIEYLKTL